MLWLTAIALAGVPSGDAARGEQLAGLAGCAACHTAEDGEPLAGGYRIETRFGTFLGPNLTPDVTDGLGAWDFEDFQRALTRGRSPQGRAYWPAFPYTSYAGLTVADQADLWAWLQAQPAVARADEPHELAPGYSRLLLGFWRLLAFDRTPWPPRGLDPALERGGYLADVVGHCGECHTPRSGIGVMKRKQWHAGNADPPEPAPDIRQATLQWSVSDWMTFLDLGMLPDGDWVGSEMIRIVEEGTSPLDEAEQRAMVDYLMHEP